jgi:cation transport protein ChaC
MNDRAASGDGGRASTVAAMAAPLKRVGRGPDDANVAKDRGGNMADGDLWIFGYGSLMWNPGFRFRERTGAFLAGRHRALCVWSRVWRGTEARPGLVLGLDRGGACRGIAYRVAARDAEATLAYLDARERVTEVYHRRTVALRLAGGARAAAETYVVDRTHPQYAGRVAPDEAARIIRECAGEGGSNLDYLENTLRHLDELGLADGPLHELARTIRGA